MRSAPAVGLPRVAILLATFNGLQFISEQIDSLLEQQAVDVTIYVSDDMSTDGTWEWLISRQEPRLVLLPRGERFGAAARNFFRLLRDVDCSGHEYVAFSDQDDIWNTDKLKIAIAGIRAKGVDAVSSNVTAFWPDGKSVVLKKSDPQCEWDFLFEAAGPGCTYVFKSTVATSMSNILSARREFAEGIALHDWFTYAWVRANGGKWWICDIPTLQYRQHAANEIGANVGFNALLGRMSKLLGVWYSSQVLLVAELAGMPNAWPVVHLRKLAFRDRLVLMFSASKFRRRTRDKLVLALAFLVMRGRSPKG